MWYLVLGLLFSVIGVQAQPTLGPPGASPVRAPETLQAAPAPAQGRVSVPEGATVTLAWTTPTVNVDGTPVLGLSGYRLYQGTASQVYGPPTPLPASVTTTQVPGLAPDTPYFFTVTAVDTQGRESPKSNEIRVAISPMPVPGLRVNIQDYGAVPDDAGDDAPAIRAAISAVIAAGGGTVVIPPGGWHIPGVLAPALLPVVSVTALSALPGFAPTQTVDNNMGTRWTAEGLGQWIQYDLGTAQTLTGVEIAWYQGHTAQTQFGVRASEDGVTWQDLYQGTSSGTSTDFERVLTGPVRARYVQIVGHGTAAAPVTSISEVRLLGTIP